MSVSTTYTYHGEICGVTKSSLERSLREDKQRFEEIWDRVKMFAMQTPPVYAENEYGDKYPYADFLIDEFREMKDELESLMWSIVHQEDCLDAMKENPDEVEDC
jgi:hypothetical protein